MAEIIRNLSVSAHTQQNSTEKSGNHRESNPIQFADVLKCEEGFKIFANHLLKEYSVLSDIFYIFCNLNNSLLYFFIYIS